MVSIFNTTGVFRNQSNIYDGAFKAKYQKSSILDVQLGYKYAHEFITLLEQICQDFRWSEEVNYPFGVLTNEVKQLTDWIHSTILLETQ